MRRKREKKLTAADTKPLETARETLDEAYNVAAELVKFCNENNITLVVGMSCFDRLVSKEVKSFIAVGPDTSVIGLATLLIEDIQETRYDDGFDEETEESSA